MTTHHDYNIQLRVNRNIFNIFLLSIIVFILLLPLIKEILLPSGLSLLLALILDPAINRLESMGIGRTTAIFIVLGLISGITGSAIIHITPLINHEIGAITKLINSDIFSTTLKESIPFSGNYEIVESLSIQFQSVIQFLLNNSVNIFNNNISILTFLIIIPIITFMLLKDGYYLKKSILQIVPNRYFEMMLNLIYKISKQLTNWFKVQLLNALIFGGLTIGALYLLNMSYYITPGILFGISHLIPTFGIFIGALFIISITIMETGSLNLVIGLIIALAVIKLLYNLLFSQILNSNPIQIHPLITILILLTGSFMWGLVGLLIIFPISSILILICKESYRSFKDYRLL